MDILKILVNTDNKWNWLVVGTDLKVILFIDFMVLVLHRVKSVRIRS